MRPTDYKSLMCPVAQSIQWGGHGFEDKWLVLAFSWYGGLALGERVSGLKVVGRAHNWATRQKLSRCLSCAHTYSTSCSVFQTARGRVWWVRNIDCAKDGNNASKPVGFFADSVRNVANYKAHYHITDFPLSVFDFSLWFSVFTHPTTGRSSIFKWLSVCIQTSRKPSERSPKTRPKFN